MRSGGAARPLAWHLGLLCGALLLPILVLAAFLLLRVAAAERERQAEAARDAAHHLAVSLDRELASLLAVVEVLASSDHLLAGNLEAFRDRLRQLPSARGATLVLHAAGARHLLAEGAAVAAAPPLGAPVSGLLALETGRPGFAVIAPVPGAAERWLSLHMPVGRVVRLLERERLPPGMVATVTDAAGRVLARRPEGEGRDTDAPGFAAHAEAELAGWTAWVFLPAAAPLQGQIGLVAAMGALLAVLAVALALAFSRRIARPIEALAAAARQPLPLAGEAAPAPSGLREVDAVAAALREARAAAAARLAAIEEVLAALDLAQVKVVDPGGRILVWTTGMERLFGWSAAEAVGRDAQDLLASEYPEPPEAIRARLRATGGWQGEVRERRRDGTALRLAAQWSLRLDAEGRPLAVVQASTDVTALRQAEARLRDTQAELRHIARLNDMGTLATTLAHEISQPLAASASFAEAALHLLEMDAPAPHRLGAAREAMREAADQIVHAGEILRRLRDFLRRGDGARAVHDLNGLVRDAVSLALGGARQRGIAARLDLAEQALPVRVDGVQIRQVVVNLVRNAIEAMEDGPRRELRVATERCDDLCRVTVADTGGGLPPEVGARLFEAFVTTKREWMGVGLSICRAIVEEHGGRLDWEPNPGGGARFGFTLQRAAEAVPERERSDAGWQRA